MTITYRYIKSKDLYVFCKRGTYWALAPEELSTMHNLTGELIAESKALGAPKDKESK